MFLQFPILPLICIIGLRFPIGVSCAYLSYLPQWYTPVKESEYSQKQIAGFDFTAVEKGAQLMADNSFITGNMSADDADGIFKDEHLGHPAQTREPARLPSKKRLIIAGIAIVTILALIGVGAKNFIIRARHEQEVRQVKEDIKQRTSWAQLKYAQAKIEAAILIKQIQVSPVADDDELKTGVDSLQKSADDQHPQNRIAYLVGTRIIGKETEELKLLYISKLSTKVGEISIRLQDLVNRANSLNSAPDSDSKTRMLKLASMWINRNVTMDNIVRAAKAADELQRLTDEVQKGVDNKNTAGAQQQ